ncbi:Spy0128 family protein [Bifidobacterium longum]|uniref:Spy0128 family protein n=1 Tax=Bifidobacterium longum TaxID=216816 RepID=UPI003BA36BA8
MDKDGKVIDSARNDKDGDIRFKPLTYGRDNNGIDDCGEHRYVIRERNTGEKNVTYDRTEHHVTVTVGDDLQGSLTAKVEYDPTDGKTDKTKGGCRRGQAVRDPRHGHNHRNPTRVHQLVHPTGHTGHREDDSPTRQDRRIRAHRGVGCVHALGSGIDAVPPSRKPNRDRAAQEVRPR